MVKINKEDKDKQLENTKVEKEKYFFPDFSITIEAENREEAEKKLKEILNKK